MKIIKPAQLPDRIPDKEITCKCVRCNCEFSFLYNEVGLDLLKSNRILCPSCGDYYLLDTDIIFDWERWYSIERLYRDVESRKKEIGE